MSLYQHPAYNLWVELILFAGKKDQWMDFPACQNIDPNCVMHINVSLSTSQLVACRE